MRPNSSKLKASLNKEYNIFEEHMKEKAPVIMKTISDKEREVEMGGIEKGQSAFNI